MRLHSTLLYAMALIPASLAAQGAARAEEAGRHATAADSVPATIAEAELLGARRASPPANNPVDSAADRTAVGTHDRKCVDVTGMAVARSGDFVAGPFDRYDNLWHSGYGKIWWQPRNVSGPAMALLVRAARLDAIAEPVVFEQRELTRSVDRNRPAETSTQFYPSGVHLPSAGKWLMVATAGENWGCFIMTVR